jgi:GMP synthase-like glutamine amidotransferase
MRALHIVHQRDSPAARFVPALTAAGFEIHDVVPGDDPLPGSLDGYGAIVACGGVQNTHETDRFPWIPAEIALMAEAIDRGVPTVGLCLGAQMLTEAAGGRVYRAPVHEVGWFPVRMAPAAASDPILGEFPRSFHAVEWHYYACEAPPGAVELARSDACLQAFRVGDVAWGTQFHIEVDRTIMQTWQREAPEELERVGYPAERYRRELDEHLPGHMALGDGMARRFAALAAERARNGAA